MRSAPSATAGLLARWHAGDQAALATLLARDLDWMRARVQQRLGPLLRQREQSADIVQDAVVEVLRYGPRFLLTDAGQFRALLARIVENVLRERHDWHRAGCRDYLREESLSSSVVQLDGAAASATTPSGVVAAEEIRATVRLGLELLDPEDRAVILLRQWQDLPFDEVGERLGIPANTARMRFVRALPRLAAAVLKLRSGRLSDLLDGAPDDTTGDGA